MEHAVVVVLVLIILIGMLITGVSVAISLATSGIIGLLIIDGFSIASNVIAGTSYSAVGKGSLIVVPMFVLMGMLTLYSGIAEKLFAIGAKILSWLPGGLGVATIFASAGFGAISGSSLATVATLGRTSIVEMMRHGYNRALASATVAASGTLSVLIPPSIILVLYGVITGESIGLLLIGAIVPGVLSAVVMAAAVVIQVSRKPELTREDNTEKLDVALGDTEQGREVRARAAAATSAGTGGQAVSTQPGLGETMKAAAVLPKLTPGSVVHAVGGVICLFTIVIGGIYSGVFTPTESAAIGAFAALVLLCAQYARRLRQLAKNLSDALKETASLNAMIFLILVGAGIFSYFLVSAGVPIALSQFVLGLDVPPTLVVILLLIILVPAGMFLDSISLLVITVPLVYGPITALGFDGIWLGILVVKLIELGMVTPPVGMNAFVTAGTTRGLESDEVFRGLIPFYVADVAIVVMLFAFPVLVTWLPALSAA